MKNRRSLFARLLVVVFVAGTVGSGSAAAQESAANAPATPQAPFSVDSSEDQVLFSGGRYRISPGDVIEFTFPRVPELDQELTVQPDGYITLREAGEIRAQGRTVPELRVMLYEAYERVLLEPEITIVLKEFQQPSFYISGEVNTPGKFELTGALTLTQALAVAGGFKNSAHTTQVVLFRRFTEDLVEVKDIDVKAMFEGRQLDEDYVLRPGDMILVPRNKLSKLDPIISRMGLGFYFNPFR